MPLATGAIERLYMKNFLIYNEVEFRPRAGLNMIVGPNGSGKSSLVCGICLALAGKPTLLGRASHTKEFIKFGCRSAELEIELYQAKGNVVIRRIIHPNRSDWRINGIDANQDTVSQTVAQLNIQVNNLCQFLPQDRVADFARMTPQELLVGTENAVGSTTLITNHDRLKQLQKNLTAIEQKIKSTEEQRDKEAQLNQHLEAELKKFKNYKEAKKQLDLYESKLMWCNYADKRDNYLVAKSDFAKMCKSREIKHTEKVRAAEQVATIENQIRNLDQRKRQLESSLQKTREQTRSAREEVDKTTERIREIQHELQEALDTEKERVEKELQLRDTVAELQQKIDTEQAKLEGDDIEYKLQSVKAKINGLNSELNKLNRSRQEKRQLVTSLDEELREALEQHRFLSQRSDPRMETLRRMKPQVYDATRWLESNRNAFKGHIYKPVLVELAVPNDRAALYLEAILGSDTLFSFVAEDPNDMEKLVKETRRRGWRINAGTAPQKSRINYTNPAPLDQLRKFGVEGFLSDLCEAPDAVFAYICDLHKLNAIPFGGDRLESGIYDLEKRLQVNRVIADGAVVNIVRSKYSNDITRVSKSLPRNKLLSVSMDGPRLKQLTERVNALKQRKEQLVAESNEFKEKAEDQNRIAQGLKDEESKLRQRVGHVHLLRDTLRVKKAQLQRLCKSPVDLVAKKAQIEARLGKEVAGFRQAVRTLAKSAADSRTLLLDLVRIVCQAENARVLATDFGQQLLVVERSLASIEAQCDELERNVVTAKQEALQMLERAKHLVGLGNTSCRSAVLQLPAELQEKFESLPNDRTELESFIVEERARLTLIMPHNVNVELEYNKRQETIQQINTSLESMKRELDVISTDVADTDRNWRAELDDLIERVDATFSRFFGLLQCEGRIELYTGEAAHQYDRYGIKILVRFRDGTELCELTPFRQSGGERSVSTILYMMALQELTVVPFRVVDEINQGMDSVNERRVFEFLVKTAEINDAQYLLVTPKLLPGLPYSEKMSVHFVNPNVAFSHNQWDLNAFLRRQQQRRKATSSQGSSQEVA